MTLLKGCLNGARGPGTHSALPLTPAQLAADARAVAAVGAGAVHMHPRDASGQESVEAEVIGPAVAAVRNAVPGLPVGVSTGNWIEPDPDRMLAHVRSWAEQPDFASVNMGQPGAIELAETLLDLGIGVEAGVWSVADAEVLGTWDRSAECLRVLIEPMEVASEDAVATAAAIDAAIERYGVPCPRLLHGQEATAWPVLDAALGLGYDVRIGLEDTLSLPDGKTAAGNADLVQAAAAWISARNR